MNSLNDWEKARREEELNQEIKRQNNLLEQQRWEQQFSNQKQQAALDEQNRLAREQQGWEQQESNQKQHAALQEQNRLAWKQNEALEERNELERQRQWNEKFRHERELELRKEQQYKDNIFDLKNYGPKLKLKMREGEFRYS